MGDRNRITKDFADGSFLRLLHDMDTHKVKHNLKPGFTRHAYAYTSAEVGRKKHGVSNV